MITLKRILTIGIAVILSACTKVDEQHEPPKERPAESVSPGMVPRPGMEDFKEPGLQEGDEVTVYKLGWRHRKPEEVLQQINGALELMGDEGWKEKVDRHNFSKLVISEKEIGSWVRLPETSLFVKYDNNYDEIRIINEEREANTDLSNRLDQAAAVKQAEGYLKQLAESKVINYELYKTASLQVGYKIIGNGSMKENVSPGNVAEYRLTFRPRLNGIEMANAGIRMGISITGKLNNLRFGGAEPESTSASDRVKIKRTAKTIMDSFYNEKAKEGEVDVAYSKVMYVIPDGKKDAIVEPKLVVSYTEKYAVENQQLVSRRKNIAYSLTDPNAPPIDFDKPAAEHESQKPSRQK